VPLVPPHGPPNSLQRTQPCSGILARQVSPPPPTPPPATVHPLVPWGLGVPASLRLPRFIVGSICPLQCCHPPLPRPCPPPSISVAFAACDQRSRVYMCTMFAGDCVCAHSRGSACPGPGRGLHVHPHQVWHQGQARLCGRRPPQARQDLGVHVDPWWVPARGPCVFCSLSAPTLCSVCWEQCLFVWELTVLHAFTEAVAALLASHRSYVCIGCVWTTESDACMGVGCLFVAEEWLESMGREPCLLSFGVAACVRSLVIFYPRCTPPQHEPRPDSGTLSIVLFKEKTNEWWSQIAVGEPEIDIKKVRSPREACAVCVRVPTWWHDEACFSDNGTRTWRA
jgi:hypothetical protein